MLKHHTNTRYHVIEFIKTLDAPQKEKLKVMLSRGISCCEGIAKANHISPEEFQAELKHILFEGRGSN